MNTHTFKYVFVEKFSTFFWGGGGGAGKIKHVNPYTMVFQFLIKQLLCGDRRKYKHSELQFETYYYEHQNKKADCLTNTTF